MGVHEVASEARERGGGKVQERRENGKRERQTQRDTESCVFKRVQK